MGQPAARVGDRRATARRSAPGPGLPDGADRRHAGVARGCDTHVCPLVDGVEAARRRRGRASAA